MDRRAVERWITDYERLWRTPGTGRLAELFAPDASYVTSPWDQPIEGLEGIAAYWEGARQGPDEEFTMSSEVIANDGQTAVARVFVEYGAPRRSWRDLWVLRFADDGRCAWFEEWPIAPDQAEGP